MRRGRRKGKGSGRGRSEGKERGERKEVGEKEGEKRGGEESIVPIVPVLRKHHWYGADHGAHTDTLHTGPDRASYATAPSSPL